MKSSANPFSQLGISLGSLLLSAAWMCAATAQDVPPGSAADRMKRTLRFGFEPTFTTPEMYLLDQSGLQPFEAYRDAQLAALERELEFGLGPAFRRWTVARDPGVIEVQPPPLSYDEILPAMESLHRAASRVGLMSEIEFGGSYGGGGHIHLDRTVFDQDPLLLRNFLVDVYNRPYLSAVLHELGDTKSARGIRERGEDGQFRKAVGRFDEEWEQNGGRITLERAFVAFRRLYNRERNRDINLRNLLRWNDPPTVEIRMHRAQARPEDYRDLAEFWMARLVVLSQVRKPIPILELTPDAVERQSLPSVARQLWIELIRESGLPEPDRYLRFLEERFPSPLRVGSAVEIRFADRLGAEKAKYEVVVGDPAIREIRLGGRAVPLSEAVELPGHLRVGTFVHEGASDRIEIEGVLGFSTIDLAQARREIESYRARPWIEAVQERARFAAGREARGAARFALAYLAKEALKAAETGDPQRIRGALGQLREPGFWGGLAVFTAAARTAEWGAAKFPWGGVTRAAVPLAAGMAAVQLLSGHASLRSVVFGTAAYLATGAAVHFLADGLLYTLIFSGGPPSWGAAGIYSIGKLAVTLYLGEKFEAWLHSELATPASARNRRQGVQQAIDALRER